jgi:SAM-dependent methyltransferase
MKDIDYNHSQNIHIMDAPSLIFPIINNIYNPKSVLDVGCGLGTWLKVVSSQNIEDFLGIDGIEVEGKNFFVPKSKFQQQDLRTNWSLGRKFDLALCLEVAEHLPSDSCTNIIRSLTTHSNTIIFSAACPYQPGQGHINCQWPEYWQSLFNSFGYACIDEIRPLIWNEDFPEWWYKQNVFVAKKDEVNAGKETRIISKIHPDLYRFHAEISSGNSSLGSYISLLFKRLKREFTREIGLH